MLFTAELFSKISLLMVPFNTQKMSTSASLLTTAPETFSLHGLSYRIGLVAEKLFFSLFVIIIMSCRKHGYPWPSLATSRYRSSPMAGLRGYFPYPHTAAVCMFELLFPGHMWGSTSLMSSSLLLHQCPAWLVRLIWIVSLMGGRWPYSWFLVCQSWFYLLENVFPYIAYILL